ncbi:MAG: flagellar hook-associated protein FlgK [Oscillospiraceae bacterium]|jgi:flagellar hook-associated protein 1 FlgK|nr:flagellar hook-associated protein FlgK [Oscillospiraceae bacterium]
MSRATFFGLEIARTGLVVSQKGLDVTGHNVANADTEGYTRQRIINTAYEPFSSITRLHPVDQALVGSGARVLILDQIRSQFLDRQYRTANTLLSEWSGRVQGLTYVESLFEGTETASLSASINNIFAALMAETTEANDAEQRVVTQQSAISLAQNFNLVYQRLQEQQASQDLSVTTIVDQINSIAESIKALNESIYAYEVNSFSPRQPANDLRDKRNLLVDQLSSLIDIEYEEYYDPNVPSDAPRFRLWIGDKTTGMLVDHYGNGSVNKLACRQDANVIDGEPTVAVPYWVDPANPTDTTNTLAVKGGELKAHMDLRDSVDPTAPGIPYFMEKLNNLVRAFAQEFNAQHRLGWTHPANASGVSQPGGDFFYVPPGGIMDITAGNFRLDDAILNDVFNIASSSLRIVMDPDDPDYDTEGTSMTGNNENALALYRIIDREKILLGAASAPAVTLTGGGTPADRAIHGVTGISLKAGASNGANLDGESFSGLSLTGSESVAVFELTVNGVVFNNATTPIDLTAGFPSGGIVLENAAGDTITINLSGAYKADDPAVLPSTPNFDALVADLTAVEGEFHGGADPFDTDASTAAFDTVSINNLVKYMSGTILDVAVTLKNGKDLMNTQSILTVDVENQRISISGVSLDEEMTNLIKYQHAYAGAARVLTTMDEALETLINKMGIVGR